MITTNIESSGKSIEVCIAGDLLSTNIMDIRKEVLTFLESDKVKSCAWEVLYMDLTKATMVDSTGLNFLVALNKHVKKNKAQFEISVRSENIHRSFTFVRLDKQAKINCFK